MRKYSGEKLQYTVRSSTILGERVVDFLRAMHPVKTVENVSADTSIGTHTVAKWMERASVPGGIAIMRLIAVYGPEFLIAAFPNVPPWLRDASRAYQLDRLSERHEALRRELDELR